jgi:hypothetical protein
MRAAGYARVRVRSEFAAEVQVMEELLLDGETEIEGQCQGWGYPPARGARQIRYSTKQLYNLRDTLAWGMLWPTKSSNHNSRPTRRW